MRHLDLFSGIGGFAIAARNVGWETVGFCEIDPYCQKVLRKHWPDVPIHGDIKDYDGQECDIITGGFPCQPYSHAGKQRGSEDDRALWPEYRRIILRHKPEWVVGENVVGIINMELDQITTDLADLDYSVDVFIIPACAVNANHRRDRVWIVAHANGEGLQGVENPRVTSSSWTKPPEYLARLLEREGGMAVSTGKGGGMHDGVSRRMDRLRGLGNAIVPQVAEVIFRAIDQTGEDNVLDG